MANHGAWDECENCGGTGVDREPRGDYTRTVNCPACAGLGRVPGSQVVEAATEAAHQEAYVNRPIIKGDDVWESWRAIVRAALIAARREEGADDERG